MRLMLPLVLLLSACATPAPPLPAFDPKQAAFIETQGKGTLEGHAFFRDPNSGKVILAAGEWVYLIPATAYADARFTQIYGTAKLHMGGNNPPEVNADYARLTRKVKAESTGRFTFDHVGPGTYYVATQVSWQPEGTSSVKGGAIYEKVTLTGSETEPVKLVVSGK